MSGWGRLLDSEQPVARKVASWTEGATQKYVYAKLALFWEILFTNQGLCALFPPLEIKQLGLGSMQIPIRVSIAEERVVHGLGLVKISKIMKSPFQKVRVCWMGHGTKTRTLTSVIRTPPPNWKNYNDQAYSCPRHWESRGNPKLTIPHPPTPPA